jgi:hypothetical protein
VELLLLLLVSGMIFYADRNRAHKMWTEYRYLTERVRSAFFQAVCESDITPIHVYRRLSSSWPLIGTEEVRSWVNLAFEEIWLRARRPRSYTQADLPALGQYVAMAWIDDQIGYHRRMLAPNQGKNRSLEKAGRLVFYLALLTAVIHFFGSWFYHYPYEGLRAGILTLASLTLPVMGSTLEGIRSHREYKRLAMRNMDMAARLENLKHSFTLFSPATLDRLLAEMEDMMLEDTREWLNLIDCAKLHAV